MAFQTSTPLKSHHSKHAFKKPHRSSVCIGFMAIGCFAIGCLVGSHLTLIRQSTTSIPTTSEYPGSYLPLKNTHPLQRRHASFSPPAYNHSQRATTPEEEQLLLLLAKLPQNRTVSTTPMTNHSNNTTRHHQLRTTPQSTHRATSSFQKNDNVNFAFAWQHTERAEDYLHIHGANALRKPLTAFLEEPMKDTVPHTGSRGDFKNTSDKGTPPDLITPLPLRTQSPRDLRKVTYYRVQTCDNLPGQWPVDKGLVFNATQGKFIQWNIGEDPLPDDFVEQELSHCPVEADPFLPWIHDVFSSVDGHHIHFVAQNKRRCQTGIHHNETVSRLVPQAALFQPVSVRRITHKYASEMAPALWDNQTTMTTATTPRYQLVPLEGAAPDGKFTRFICRYSALEFGNDKSVRTVTVGETLSVYPFNYEMATFRKGLPVYTPKGRDTGTLIAATLIFSCPVPTTLQSAVSHGRTVLSDGTPTVWLDLVPIRTSARYPHLHLSSEHLGPIYKWGVPRFDVREAWGLHHVLPHVEASGRWSNIPVCRPPQPVSMPSPLLQQQQQQQQQNTQLHKHSQSIAAAKGKPHFLSACVWASAEFRDFGLGIQPTSDTNIRLLEWLEFHFMVGFDHIYLYDNSRAHTNATSLKSVADMYPDRVTWVDWPFVPCNNNKVSPDASNERSSQFAASNSCRIRVTPYSEWIAEFGT
jgi:hypothetical protein